MQDNNPPPQFISSQDFTTLRNAFKTAVADGLIGQADQVQHVTDLIRELTGEHEPVDGLMNHITGALKG